MTCAYIGISGICEKRVDMDMVSELTLITTAQYNTFEDATKTSVEVTHQTTGRTLT